MKKIYKLEDLDCAGCADKIEREINKIERVSNAKVSFITQKLTLEADDCDIEEIVAQVKKIIGRIEPDCKLKI